MELVEHTPEYVAIPIRGSAFGASYAYGVKCSCGWADGGEGPSFRYTKPGAEQQFAKHTSSER